MLFRRNNLNIGIGLGILVPIIVFGLLYSITNLTGWNFKIRSLGIIGICCNMLIVRAFSKNRVNESIRGTVIATVAMAFLWFAWFYKDIMAEW
jgi:predicted tellurium resistance membrane protein TerC